MSLSTRVRRAPWYLAPLFLLPFCSTAAPTPGQLDAAFVPPADRAGTVFAVAEQNDGRILMGGRFGLLRLQSDGTLDSAFAAPLQGGPAGPPRVTAVALQSDGKILVGGQFTVPGPAAVSNLVRLWPDGTPDITFGAGTSPDGPVEAMTVQSDGRILIGGQFQNYGSTPARHVTRLFMNGQPDSNFQAGTGPDHYVFGIIAQPDGHILIRGDFAHVNGKQARGIARLNWDGSLDTTFDTLMTSIPSCDAFALQEDGKVFVSGLFSFGLEPPTYHLARLNTNGSVDVSFGTYIGGGRVSAILVQTDGKVVIGGGFTNLLGTSRSGVARLMSNGLLDASFDPGNGITGSNDTGAAGPAVYSLLPVRDRKLLVTGNFTQFDGVPRANIARVYSDFPRPRAGSVVVSYVPPKDVLSRVLCTTEQPDGRVLAGGYYGLMRLKQDGSLDTDFRPHLWPASNMWPELYPDPSVNTIALQTDGKVLAGGYFILPPQQRTNLARFWPDGSADTEFGGGASPNGRVACIIVQPNGYILIGGAFDHYGQSGQPRIARLRPDGQLDPTFDPGAGPDGQVLGIVLQPDGRILITGDFHYVGGQSHPGLARLLPDGSVDGSFAVNDIHGWDYAVALEGNGSFIVGGFFSFSREAPAHRVVRLFANGSLDRTFQAGCDQMVHSIALQPDGKAVLGGEFTRVAGLPRNGVARLLTGGAVDPSFDPGTGISGLSEGEVGGPGVFTVSIMRNSDVLIGGFFQGFDGIPRDNIARLHGDLPMPASFVIRRLPRQGEHTVQLIAQPASSVAAYAVEEHIPDGVFVDQISHGGIFDGVTRKIKFGPFYDAALRTLTYNLVFPPLGVHGVLGVYYFEGIGSADGIDTPIAGDQALVVAALFPADLPSADSRLTIDEVTAYGAAWRRGESWPVDPSPITIEYVTRAAFLWRAGECYTVDPTVLTEPLWWVPCNPVQHFTQNSGMSVTSRSLPTSYVPGEPIAVTVSVQPGAAVSAYAAEEKLPPGWSFVSTTAGGEWDARTGLLRWGPFLDNSARDLTYITLPPTAAGGPAGFTGQGSFDGIILATRGDLQLAEGFRFSGANVSNDQFLLTLSGRSGRSYLIEFSSDLKTWQALGIFTNCPARLQIIDSFAPSCPARFYRALPR